MRPIEWIGALNFETRNVGCAFEVKYAVVVVVVDNSDDDLTANCENFAGRAKEVQNEAVI